MTPLRQQVIEDMTVRNLAPTTQATYVQQISMFARHFDCSPAKLGPEEIRSYQVYLATEKQLAPSSIGTTVAALRFFYNVTLEKHWGVGRRPSDAQNAGHVTGRSQPRRSPAVSGERRIDPTPDDPDDLLRGRAADLGSRPPEARPYRQSAHGDSCRTR